ncbi:hypothetical protein GCM10011514_30380 [Emticicia aquatilis]|uniref:Uncharacterized protein n=1 Tax=Emticicia aquatilis TaxID=1537369 RepID=A0A916YWB9_9BACT|nr:hypothetical protein [Emticicia aquatilis]GGD64342.1 hypothetical protein GCM10011514_30380 [Emticicia aquatilis]
MAIIISLLALLATFYQLYLQRLHNEKSLKPLGQIDVGDRKTHIYVHIQNNGLGPLIIKNVVFIKDGITYKTISECLKLAPKSYWHISLKGIDKKVILPNAYFVIFDKNTENNSPEEIEDIKKQLTPITLKVSCRDIYDNKFSFERNLEWFSRHIHSEDN